jgi:hypothetical protein
MVTKRTPIARHHMASISERAVELYLAMKRIRCTCPPPEPGFTSPKLRDQCGNCERWWSLHNQLADELKLRPWFWPVIVPPTRILHRDGVVRPRQPAQHMVETEARLKEAAKDRRAVREQVERAEQEATNVDPAGRG